MDAALGPTGSGWEENSSLRPLLQKEKRLVQPAWRAIECSGCCIGNNGVMTSKAIIVLTVALAGCDRLGGSITCYRDDDGIVWTNKRLMDEYARRGHKVNGIDLCYPHVGLSRKEIGYGRKCPHPKQVIKNGWCRCDPYPDVLFSQEDVEKVCREVK